MKISVPYFKGMVPKVNSRLLPEGHASDCTNIYTKSGDLQAWNQPSTLYTLTPAGIKTIYKMQTADAFLRWSSDVNVARAPIAGDTNETLIFTGALDNPSSGTDARPKVTNRTKALGTTVHAGNTAGNYPNDWLILGVPAPSSAPTASAGAPSDATNTQTTNYVYTYVNELGYEGEPSTASNIVTFTDGDTITVTGISDPTYPNITDYGLYAGPNSLGTKNLYRATTASSGQTEYLFVASVPYGTTSYVDTHTDATLGETLPSANWGLPPTDGFAVLSLPNGITVMASKNNLYLSEQNHPHAYPLDYVLTTDFPIVGLGAIDTTVVILTKANPYIALGTDPSQFSMAKIELPYGCVSKRSIAYLNSYGIVYASPNGLVAINGTGANLISEPYFTREQWQALFPESIYAFVHDDRYFFFFDRIN